MSNYVAVMSTAPPSARTEMLTAVPAAGADGNSQYIGAPDAVPVAMPQPSAYMHGGAYPAVPPYSPPHHQH
ncbi:hypothetical protein OFC56_41355, partial [Escherichia coli]|nr:hypothetical protein [Escherichia coli]